MYNSFKFHLQDKIIENAYFNCKQKIYSEKYDLALDYFSDSYTTLTKK